MDVLDNFIQNATASVKEGYYGICEEFPGRRVSLRRELESHRFSLIAEIKHASPTGEYSFEKIDAERTACLFREYGADAISVVVEPKIFKGRVMNIPAAKKAGLAVLFKDFVFCEEQVKAARMLGADAILLIVKVAQRLSLNLDSMIDIVHCYGLEAILETYDENEMKIAMKTDADILGINNRNLQTLGVDIRTTERILSTVGELDRPLMSESGIRTGEDALFVKNAGADGILVGTAIWKSGDIGKTMKELKSV